MKKEFLFFVVLAGISLWAIHSLAWARATWTTYAKADGLAGNVVSQVMEDSKGNIWFATSEGVSKYDGLKWTTFTEADGLAGNLTTSIWEDSEGHIWVGSFGGLSKYDGANWVVLEEPFWLCQRIEVRYESGVWFSYKDVMSIKGDTRGNIWVGTKVGLHQYDGSRWMAFYILPAYSEIISYNDVRVEFSSPLPVYSISEDNKGNMWFGTDMGAIEYDGVTWEIFNRDDGLLNDNMRTVCADTYGNIWFGTLYGVTKYDGETWKTFTKDDGLAGNNVCSIYEDYQGDMWFGTEYGVTRYRKGEWITFTIEDGLAHNMVLSILEDSQGNIWFATIGGVSKYNNTTWMTLTTETSSDYASALPVEGGLASNFVRAIFKDSQGNIWVGTDGGVSKYDGKSWILFTMADGLASNRIWTIGEDKAGNMWFGTDNGVSKFDGLTWTTFTKADGLSRHDSARAIVGDEMGNIWCVTPSGTYMFDGKTWTRLFPGAWDSAMTKDAQGNIWLGTGSEVRRYDYKVWITFTATDVGFPNTLRYGVNTIVEDRQHNIWIGTNGGVSKYDGESWTPFTTADGLAGHSVKAIGEDDEGNMWFGVHTVTDGRGVSRFDGVSWTTFTEAEGLSSNLITAIARDDRGKMWFGTAGDGIITYDGTLWAALVERERADYDNVQAVYQDSKGHIWFATRGGLIRHDGITWRTFTIANGLPRDHVRSILEDRQGNMWLATSGGVCEYDGTRFETFTVADGLPNSRVLSVAEDNQGNIWVGTEGGTAKYDGKIWTPFTEVDGLASNIVLSITEDSQGNMWFGTYGGASRYSGGIWTTYTEENGLADNYVRSVITDSRGNMWFGTDGGVSRFDGALWQTFTEADGLASDSVWPILEDRRGNMWFGTDSGISKFDGVAWATFAIMDGLSSNEIQSIFEDRRDNIIWFGTLAGVHRHQVDMVPPKIAIMAGPDDNSVVASDSVVFVYRGGDLITPGKDLLYSVWPDPNRPFPEIPDSNDPRQWSSYSSATTASFTDLPDGEHTFCVMAKDKDLNRASTLSTFTIDTTPATAAITSPRDGSTIGGEVVISGTAFDADGRFRNYSVQYHEHPEDASSDWKLLNHADIPVEKDAQLAVWNTIGLNGGYEIRLVVTDELERQNTYDVEVVVDNIAPLARIIRPGMDSVISGTVTMRLEVTDEHLDGFWVDYSKAPGPAKWEEVPTKSGEGTIEAQWNAHELEGEYTLRLTAMDMAGNRAVDIATVTVARTIDARRGGYVEDLTGKVRICIPPNALLHDAGITVNQMPRDELQTRLRNLSSDITPTDVAYDLHKEELLLQKPATVTIQYSDDEIATVHDETRLALFAWSGTSQTWQRIGGTVNKNEKTIKAAITKLSILAVMEDRRPGIGKPFISQVHCQPRVFSPNGNVYSTKTDISFKLGSESLATIKVYDVDGRLRRVLTEDQRMSQGIQVVSWNGRNDAGEVLPTGLYLIAITIGEQRGIKTVVIQNR
jgi:ligand-binding sensor domain-containing protein